MVLQVNWLRDGLAGLIPITWHTATDSSGVPPIMPWHNGADRLCATDVLLMR